MRTINMRSQATSVKGQGVGSVYIEQVGLLQRRLKSFGVLENSRKKCDVYHYHTINFSYYLERLLMKRKTAAVGFVHFLPDTIDESLKLPWIARKIFYSYILSFYNSMDFLVAVNPSIIKRIAEYNINKPSVSCIPNFVSSAKFFVTSDDERTRVREKYGIPRDKFVVLGAGQLQTRKGVADFVKVAEALPNIQFIWAGGFSFGKITDGYKQIKAIVENPPKNMMFLGIIDREQMNGIYNMSDMLFLPSYDELFPMVILEALACRRPVLLRDIDIYKTILEGSYLKASDVGGFCERITSVAGDAALYKTWSDAAYNCGLKYNEDSILKMWESLYGEAYWLGLKKSGLSR